jgi:hypothetical protein
MMIDINAALAAHRRLSLVLPCSFYSPLKIHESISSPSARDGNSEQRILTALTEIGTDATIADIVAETGLHDDTVRKTAARMAERGVLISTVRANKLLFYRVRLWLD